jgi:hypothetical protein
MAAQKIFYAAHIHARVGVPAMSAYRDFRYSS